MFEEGTVYQRRDDIMTQTICVTKLSIDKLHMRYVYLIEYAGGSTHFGVSMGTVPVMMMTDFTASILSAPDFLAYARKTIDRTWRNAANYVIDQRFGLAKPGEVAENG